MLTQNLRPLERDGIVSRTVQPTSPVRIEYQLSPLGVSLLDPLAALRDWAVYHLSDVIDARDAHDAHRVTETTSS